MIILGIETSCDETAASVAIKVNGRIEILSNIVASSALLQAKYGGVIPEQAAREQLKSVIPVIREAINDSRLTIHDIDAISVTQGPGLIGSLLVGVETAKVLSLVWNKPLIPVNHLLGHFYGNWIMEKSVAKNTKGATSYRLQATGSLPFFPSIGLLVSGGHSDIVLFKGHNNYEYLGGTRDDAAGECFDKSARILGLGGVQGGPIISRLAAEGNPKAFPLPRPLQGSADFDYSFSGLKTAIINLCYEKWNGDPAKISEQELRDLCASLQEAIVDSLVEKVIKAAQTKGIDQIMIAGGVASNIRLKEKLRSQFRGHVLAPLPSYCTDNAAMIAAAGFFGKPLADPLNLQANPSLSLTT